MIPSVIFVYLRVQLFKPHRNEHLNVLLFVGIQKQVGVRKECSVWMKWDVALELFFLFAHSIEYGNHSIDSSSEEVDMGFWYKM